MKRHTIKSWTEKYRACTVVYNPRFTTQEKLELTALKNEMDTAYPHEDGSKWSDETTEVRVIDGNGNKQVGLIPTDNMVYVLELPYAYELAEVK